MDDDCSWGGGNLHGLYNPDHTADSVILDFFTFCKLAAWRQVVPHGWDWEKFLVTAAGMLLYAFEKSDAKDEYGSENVFSAMSGTGRSLRFTAEVRCSWRTVLAVVDSYFTIQVHEFVIFSIALQADNVHAVSSSGAA